MKLRLVWCLLTALAVAAGGVLQADEKQEEPKVKALCPISGGAADMSVSADYKGGKVYFCCAGCIPKFEKDTEKYAAKANHQLVVTGQAKQVACPLTGKEVNAEKSAEVAGVKVCFCCGGCQGKVAKAEAAEQMDLCFGKGFDKGFKVEAKEKKS